MNLNKLLFVALFFVFTACEKDDICDDITNTTPMLTIEFYDLVNTSVLKNVQNLTVQAINQDQPVNFNPNPFQTPQTIVTTNKISIPLQSFEEQTTFRFIFNANNEDLINEDILTFNYTTQDVFVSRGCGFKTVYNNLQPILLTNPVGDNIFWIDQILINNINITNTQDIHVKIFF